MAITSVRLSASSNGTYMRKVSEKDPDEGHGSQLLALFGLCDEI